jgi:hypothetical protein
MSKKFSDISIRRRFPPNFWTLTGILVFVTLVSTLILSPRLALVLQPSYKLGDIADKNIKAPADFLI